MIDLVTQKKWDRAAPNFDAMAGHGAEIRWAPFKKEFFSQMKPGNQILFLALGTGLDIEFFPSGLDLETIDISPVMLEQAKPRLENYQGSINAQVMDVHDLAFPDEHFDQVFTSCTFCSVPNPVGGLKSLNRVLKPDGSLHMFEHTGSHYYPFKIMMELMTLLTEKIGPSMNRETVANVEAAGFEVLEVNNLFLDVVKTIRAQKPQTIAA